MPSSSTEPGARHPLLFRAGAVALGVGIALLAAEAVLRLLPVATGLLPVAVNARNPIFRFEPDREYVWSIGWDFAVVNRGRSNNAGFVNDQTYLAHDGRPLLAVIGDSYVEAMMVPYADTVHGRLARRVGEGGRVYSLAASGAPLSQYLAWARHARERFGAAGLVFVVVGNDFDESLARYKTGAGFHHFVSGADGALRLRRYDYEPAGIRRMVRRSALARYLVFNLHVEVALRNALSGVLPAPARADAPRYVGNTASEADAERIALSRAAVDAFLAQLPAATGLPADRIAFLVDGLRPQIYQGDAAEAAVADSYFARMRDYLMTRAAGQGHEVVDLGRVFRERYRRDGARFEFENDFHWNAEGHAAAESALAASRLVERLFGRPPPR